MGRCEADVLPNRVLFASWLRTWRCFAVAGAALAALGQACSVGDQSCAPAYNEQDLTDHCPYGPPGGPQLSAPPANACPPPDPPSAADACGSVGWTEDVWPVLTQVGKGKGACAANGCHAPPNGAKGVSLPESDAAAAYDALSAYKGALTVGYIDKANPTASWIACNLRGDVGIPMPYLDVLDPDDLALVERWVRCGAPLERAGGGGAGGGT